VHVFGFVMLPVSILVAIAGITVLYVLATELLKRWFYRNDLAARPAA
jgi:hypothetical protein